MYYIEHKKAHLYLSSNGMDSLAQIQAGNLDFLAMPSIQKAKTVLNQVKATFPTKERGFLQVLKENSLKKNLEKPENQQSTVAISLALRQNLKIGLEHSLKQKLCVRVEASPYFLLLPGKTAVVSATPSPKDKVSPQKLPFEQASVQAALLQASLTQQAQSAPSQPTESEAEKVLIAPKTLVENPFLQEVEGFLLSFQQIQASSQRHQQEYDQAIKLIESRIIDELHFIEFEAPESANSGEVYQRLHALRQERRKLKDNYMLSGLVQSLFQGISPDSVSDRIERVQNVAQRRYLLRAPGQHPERGL